MIVLSFMITALVVVLLLAFAAYVVAVSRLPSDRRPRPPVYNRFGELIGRVENPDFHVNPGEEKHSEPRILRPGSREA